MHAAAAEHRENRSGIGGADDRADQQALNQREIEDPHGEQADDGAGDEHAECGEGERRTKTDPEGLEAGTQPAIEKDHGQREMADQEGQRVIVELDTQNTVFAGQHAQPEEDQQQRQAHHRGDAACHDTQSDKEAG